jgi:hypothetical protein
MKSIKPIVLKEAKFLSNEEMKHIFGGSSADSGDMSSCSADCGSQPSVSITDCIGTCTGNPGSSVTCSGATRVLTKNCDGTSSITIFG